MGVAKQAVWAGVVVSVVGLAGCSVRVNKQAGNGEDKDVSIKTPFGGLQVHKNGGGSANVGLPAYPGAVLEPEHGDDDKSVDVKMGFGAFQMRVQVANYSSTDPQSKVESFYRKALAQYGEVLVCRGGAPVGTPVRTAEGLTCKDSGDGKNAHVNAGDAELQLKAGSDRRQHIVAFKDREGAGTHFSLINLQLPAEHGGSAEE